MQITVTIPDLAEAKRRFAQMPAKVGVELGRAIKRSSFVITAAAKKELGRDKGGWDTGRMASSISPSFSPFRAEIAPHVNYAIYVHQGTRPHWVPIAAISPWARRHNINPYAVQAGIARKGTKANPFMERAAAASQDEVTKTFVEAIAKIVAL